MRTRLFDWAEKQGLELTDLAQMTGYSERHLLRIKSGEYPVNDAFRGRVVLALGDWARSLFLPGMSEHSDTVSEHAAEPPSAAPERVSVPREGPDTRERENGAPGANVEDTDAAA